MFSIDSYKLNFIATDGSSEAEFFCFDSVARRIVGKPCETLVAVAQISQGPSADLATIVSLKFFFAVTINMRAFSMTNIVFSILSILTNHGRQSSVPSSLLTYPNNIFSQDDVLGLTTTHQRHHFQNYPLLAVKQTRYETSLLLFATFYKHVIWLQPNEVHLLGPTIASISRCAT